MAVVLLMHPKNALTSCITHCAHVRCLINNGNIAFSQSHMLLPSQISSIQHLCFCSPSPSKCRNWDLSLLNFVLLVFHAVKITLNHGSLIYDVSSTSLTGLCRIQFDEHSLCAFIQIIYKMNSTQPYGNPLDFNCIFIIHFETTH